MEHMEYALIDEFDGDYRHNLEYGDDKDEFMHKFDEMNDMDDAGAEINESIPHTTKKEKKKKKKKNPHDIANKQFKPIQAFWYRDKLVHDAYSKKKRKKKYDACHSRLTQ